MAMTKEELKSKISQDVQKLGVEQTLKAVRNFTMFALKYKLPVPPAFTAIIAEAKKTGQLSGVLDWLGAAKDALVAGGGYVVDNAEKLGGLVKTGVMVNDLIHKPDPPAVAKPAPQGQPVPAPGTYYDAQGRPVGGILGGMSMTPFYIGGSVLAVGLVLFLVFGRKKAGA